MITKKTIAEKILAYLQHHISAAEIVNWAEQTILDGSYQDDDVYSMRNILAQLGLADVKTFGLEYQDCEAMMQKLA